MKRVVATQEVTHKEHSITELLLSGTTLILT